MIVLTKESLIKGYFPLSTPIKYGCGCIPYEKQPQFKNSAARQVSWGPGFDALACTFFLYGLLAQFLHGCIYWRRDFCADVLLRILDHGLLVWAPWSKISARLGSWRQIFARTHLPSGAIFVQMLACRQFWIFVYACSCCGWCLHAANFGFCAAVRASEQARREAEGTTAWFTLVTK